MLIKFIAKFKEITDINKIEIDLNYTNNISELLNYLIQEYSFDLKNLFFTGDNLKKDITILVNGRNIRFINGLETKIDNSDRIVIFPPMAGG